VPLLTPVHSALTATLLTSAIKITIKLQIISSVVLDAVGWVMETAAGL